MNYFELYPGDYLRDTTRLSLVDHGAYLRLLMAYYAEEQPLPADEGELFTIVSAVSSSDKASVRKVASRFFPVGSDGLRRNSRADKEIAKAQKRIATARENGSKNRPVKNPPGNPPGIPEVTQRDTQSGEALHIPHATNHQDQKLPPTAAVAPPPDLPVDPIWGTGLAWLIRKGIPEKQARSLIGSLRKTAGDIETGAILATAEAQDITDPVPWLMRAASSAKVRAGPNHAAPTSKTMGAILALEELKNGLDQSRITHGVPALTHAGP